MIKKEAQLNPKIFDADVEQLPIRQGFGEGLLEAGKRNKNVVALCADLTESTKMDAFAKAFPERFIEIGVAEQNLAAVGSGMAAMGKIPVISSYAMFSPGRNWEQIRTTICYNDRKVIIAGSHAGVSVGPDGGTHQAIEDIAITRVIPRMTVLTPCDSIEAKKALLAAIENEGPVYIRLAREKTPIITTEETPFSIGKSEVFYESDDATIGIIACGALVHNALLAARLLDEEGTSVSVLNIGTVKPLDKEGILAFAKKHKGVVTVEEHQAAGGMGSAVSELLAQEYSLPMKIVGVQDQFGQSGKPEELIKHYGLDAPAIATAARVLAKKI